MKARRVEPPKGGAQKPPGLHTTAREPKRAHLRVPAFKNTTNSTRRHPEKDRKRTKMVAGEGKQRVKFWAVRRRAVRRVRCPVVWRRVVQGPNQQQPQQPQQPQHQHRQKWRMFNPAILAQVATADQLNTLFVGCCEVWVGLGTVESVFVVFFPRETWRTPVLVVLVWGRFQLV